jgi:hypothetical protein
VRIVRYLTSATLAASVVGLLAPAALADPTSAKNYSTETITCDTLGPVTVAFTSSPVTLYSAGKVVGTQLTLILRYVEVTKTDAAGNVVSDEITASKPGAAPINEHCSFSFIGDDGLTVTISGGFLLRGPGSA